VCKRCDIDARPSEALCAQCVNVFVRRGNVDTTERVRKERAVFVYQRKRGWLLRCMAVVAGASHVLLGYPILGFLFLLLTGFIAAALLLWPGVIRDPYAVRDVFSPLRLAEVAAVCVLLYGVYLRELWARLRIEGI
jgi:hypothetical protein